VAGVLYVILNLNTLSDIQNKIEQAFSKESGPARCMHPNFCEESAEADLMLLNLDPSDMEFSDLSEEDRNWIFSFVTPSGLRWLLPGLINAALTQSPPQPSYIYDLLKVRSDANLNCEQKAVLSELREFCYISGYEL
jgi:hypothetical protein